MRLLIRWAALPALLVAVVGTLASCASGGSDSGDGSGIVRVFAAASLADAFAAVAEDFEQANPEFTVELNLAGSSTLREQIIQGAPADVFASANESTMAQVDAAGEVADGPFVFARNRLALVVPAGNPGAVADLADLEDEALLVGLCSPGVPCGDLARHVLQQAGIEPSIDTNEPDVRSLLTKVEVGELDVALVYQTDVRSAEDAVEGLTIGAEVDATTNYLIATLAAAGQSDGAAAFVDYVMSSQGSDLLAAHGFEAP